MIRSESRRRAVAVMEGRPDAVGLEPQLHSDGDLVQLARLVREKSGRPRLCSDPRHLARRLKIPVIDRLPQGCPGECTSGREIRYEWMPSSRDRGFQIGHGLGHGVFPWAKTPDHNEADAIILSGELLFPEEMVLRVHSAKQAAALTPHAPEWFLELQIDRVLRRLRAR